MTFRTKIVAVLLVSATITAVTGGIGLYFAVRLIAAFNSVTAEHAPFLEHMDDLASYADRALLLAREAENREAGGGESLRRELQDALANLSLLQAQLRKQSSDPEALASLERFVAEEKLYGNRITELLQATITEARLMHERDALFAKSKAARSRVDQELSTYSGPLFAHEGAARSTYTERAEGAVRGLEYAWKLAVAEGALKSAENQEELSSARGALVPPPEPISAEVDNALSGWHSLLAGTGGVAEAVSRYLDAAASASALESSLEQESGALIRSLNSVASVTTLLSETTSGSFLLNATPHVLVSAIVLAILLSLLFGASLTRNLTRHIHALAQATRAMSAGDYSVRVHVDSNDELGGLAESFNAMAEDVSDARREIAELNDRLEERVKQRTKELLASREQIRSQERQLIQADKMAALGVLVSGVAHEVNNPNQAIRMSGELLSRSWPDIIPALEAYFGETEDALVGGTEYADFRSVAGRALETVISGSRRIDAIVTSLKDYARQGPSDERVPVNLTLVVKSALILLENLIKNSTDRCHVEIDNQIPTFSGSPQRIEQVVINVVQNACQALEVRSRSIRIVTRHVAETVQFVVSDQGRGIEPEDLERVTDPFFTTKRDSGGTGLGLSVSSGIVKDAGGTIDIESEPGRGTTVTVSFPIEGREE